MNKQRTSTIREVNQSYKERREQELELQSRKRKGLIRRLSVLGGVAFILFVAAAVIVFNQLTALAEKEQEKLALEEELERLEQEEAYLQQEIINYNNEDYVTEIARRDYYLSGEDEILFKLPETSSD